ncbi:MAG: glycosyltransferase [Clostridia bacterium]|nr:glycosyltransferase [Clostridia bacterium]
MKHNAVVSVIVPVYNGEGTIGKTMASIQNQSFSSLDIIVIDDGSTDRSAQICRGLAQKDGRVRVFSQANAGLSAARNAGIERALGEWVTFVDSDDVIHPNMIEILLDDVYASAADMGICGAKKVDTQDVDYAANDVSRAGTVAGIPEVMINEALNNGVPLYSWGKIMRREAFASIQFPRGRFYEDEITSLKLLLAASKITFNAAGLYYYVQNATGITKQPREKHAYDLIENENEIERLLEGRPGISSKALHAHLCSNYTLAYNIVYKCGGNPQLYDRLKKLNDRSYGETDFKNIRRQVNWRSIVLLRLGCYKWLLKLSGLLKRR